MLLSVSLWGIAWLLLASFVWLERDPSLRDSAFCVGGAAGAAYLLALGYLSYVRVHWTKPAASRLSPLVLWFLTTAVLGAFGLVIGIWLPDLTNGFAGELFVLTLTLGGIAFGLVSVIVSANARVPAAHGDTRPPSFLRSATRVVLFPAFSLVGAGVLFGPAFLVVNAFEKAIDVPACQVNCQSHGYEFESMRTGKATYDCNCLGVDGHHTFHDRAYLGGGSGFGAAAYDALVRGSAALSVALGWPALLAFGAFKIWGSKIGALQIWQRRTTRNPNRLQ
jgi:hypothetical protein